jgi:hypothetical protein
MSPALTPRRMPPLVPLGDEDPDEDAGVPVVVPVAAPVAPTAPVDVARTDVPLALTPEEPPVAVDLAIVLVPV